MTHILTFDYKGKKQREHIKYHDFIVPFYHMTQKKTSIKFAIIYFHSINKIYSIRPKNRTRERPPSGIIFTRTCVIGPKS